MRIGPVIAGLGTTAAPIVSQEPLLSSGVLVQFLAEYRLPSLYVYAFFQTQMMHAKTRLSIDQVISCLTAKM